MNAVTFDTLRFARILQEQGKFTPEQSTSLVEALGGVLAADIATRTDIAGVQTDLREGRLQLEMGIAEAERRLEAKLVESERRLEAKIVESEHRLETKLVESEHRLEAKIAEIRVDMANVKADLVKWMFGTVGLQTVVILGAVVALARVLH